MNGVNPAYNFIYREGAEAFTKGVTASDNPYDDLIAHYWWNEGWRHAKYEDMKTMPQIELTLKWSKET